MIALGSDWLLFELANGESIPYSADMVEVDLAEDSDGLFDPEFVSHATKAVFHYFKHELGRQRVSVGEFTVALEKVLRGFAATAQPPVAPQSASRVPESDLCRLAQESGQGRERRRLGDPGPRRLFRQRGGRSHPDLVVEAAVVAEHDLPAGFEVDDREQARLVEAPVVQERTVLPEGVGVGPVVH